MNWWSENISFVHPQFFFLLLLLPVLAVWYLRRQDRRYATLRWSDLRGVSGVHTWRERLRPALPVLRLLALALLIVAMARPQRTLREEEIKAEGIDIMLVMDLSSSMLARDFEPDRLEVCKRVAATFVDKREYDRIGLAVFAGEAFTQCPLTTDHGVVKAFLAELECGILEDGTAIGMGLATSVNRLKDSPAQSKVVILLTDGVNNAGYLKPITAAEIAEEYGVKVYTIGVGSNGDALTPISRRSDGRYQFGLARVEIDEALLQQIAEMTGGRYFRALSEEGLEEIYAEIDQLEKTEIDVTVIRRYSEEFYRLVTLALGLLLLELVARYTFLRSIP